MRGSKKDVVQTNGALYKLFEAVYVPLLLNKWVRPVVVVGFFAWICTSLAVIPHVDVGLDQEQSVPADSPVQKYFSVSIQLSMKMALDLKALPFNQMNVCVLQYLKNYLSVGPPVYFVVTEGLDYSDVSTQNVICSGLYCNKDSLLTQLYSASQNPSR